MKEVLDACVCGFVCVSPLGINSVETFPRQRRNVGGVVFYVACIITKESK
jgi:hypothetical protein